MRPTRRTLILWTAGGALVALPLLGPLALWPPAVGGAALLILALAADALLCPRARHLELELTTPETLLVGDRGQARLRLALPVPRPLPAEVTLDVGRLLEPVGRQAFALAAGAEVKIALLPRRRGEAVLEAAWVRWEGPLGLLRRTVRRPLDRRIPVVPNLPRVSAAALQFFRARNALAGVKVETYRGDGTEFDSLREFQPGLDIRSIDWKASARHTRLLAREHRAERNHHIVLGLDTGRLMAEPVDGMPLLDHAIHALLLLAFVSLRHGDRVSLYPFAARPGNLSAPRGGPGALRGLLRQTTRLRYSRQETNFTLALTELAARLRRRSLVLVMTDFADSITAELMVDNLLRLNRRHLVVFVAFRDPALEHLQDVEPRRRRDLDRAVVASALIRERQEVLRTLGREGVLTLDAAPAEVGPGW